jgi:arsenate reductase
MLKRVLFLCTGNSCRSQMAEGIINHDFAGEVEAVSAGTSPHGLNSKAVQVMSEIGIDISNNSSDHISLYDGQDFHWVISLCDNADTQCPSVYSGIVRTHMPFDDPPQTTGSENEIMAAYRRIRDQIREQLGDFFRQQLQ